GTPRPPGLEARRTALKERQQTLIARRDRLKDIQTTGGGDEVERGLAQRRTRDSARKFAWFAVPDILVFFGVLLVGFAYLWRRGDLDWVRSTAAQQQKSEVRDQRSEETSVASAV